LHGLKIVVQAHGFERSQSMKSLMDEMPLQLLGV